ncbi:hypothetical protein RF11_04010 [Thelohanellus kitauei]|uniref:Uncharacterized protein n=1 Tax=Thelohanellus kitauei TaxID=669202 RepID=A0A0C2JIQ7_THEKT|nr:hypothetical protein RF11_04010 [Thelohanellus kitauei]
MNGPDTLICKYLETTTTSFDIYEKLCAFLEVYKNLNEKYLGHENKLCCENAQIFFWVSKAGAEPPNKYNQIDDGRRSRIIAAHQAGSTIRVISQYENLPRSSISSILKKVHTNGRVEKKREEEETHTKLPLKFSNISEICYKMIARFL